MSYFPSRTKRLRRKLDDAERLKAKAFRELAAMTAERDALRARVEQLYEQRETARAKVRTWHRDEQKRTARVVTKAVLRERSYNLAAELYLRGESEGRRALREEMDR